MLRTRRTVGSLDAVGTKDVSADSANFCDNVFVAAPHTVWQEGTVLGFKHLSRELLSSWPSFLHQGHAFEAYPGYTIQRCAQAER